MVVVKNYSENFLQKDRNFQREPEIDEDRAYVVGLWIVIIVAALLLLLLAVIGIGRSRNNEQIANESAKQDVLGEKEKTTKPQKEVTKQVETSPSTEASEKASNVNNLERPLTEAETLEKAKTMPGSKIHTVSAGESLYQIGEKYDVDWKEIAEVNNLSAPYNLHSGQKLIIAAP